MHPLQFQPDFAGKRSHNLHEAYQLPCVQWITPDDGHRRCPKHVGFYDKNKFWLLVHLVGYFYETYYDARSPEHKVKKISCFIIWTVEARRISRISLCLFYCLNVKSDISWNTYFFIKKMKWAVKGFSEYHSRCYIVIPYTSNIEPTQRNA